MSKPVISIRGIGKKYDLGETLNHNTLRDHITHGIKSIFRKNDKQADDGSAEQSPADSRYDSREFWALKDVSFDVDEGEVIGIIGRNGAGKSTLLKVLSEITDPTEGEIRVQGRIASLLEVGTGFHPELTGRENIYLNGAILGMTKREIKSKFDEIVDFSGVKKFLDTPVKRYSSGMAVRLGFAVAAHLEPEILVVDEVLAVGDAEFQRKCIGKMKNVAEGGRTVLFVSHNMAAVQSLCDRAIRLEEGKLVDQGDVKDVIDAYLNYDCGDIHLQEWENKDEAPGNDMVKVRKVQLSYPGQENTEPIYTTTPIAVTYQFWNEVEGKEYNISTHLRKPSGEVIFNTWSHKEKLKRGLIEGTLNLPGDFLNSGVFSLDLMLVSNSKAVYKMDPAVQFQVHDRRGAGTGWHGQIPGAIRPVFLKFPLKEIEETEGASRG